jgi:nicotinamidase-related amidase
MRPRHHSLLNRDDTVLVVIDMQEPFLRSIFECERVIERCQLLISSANILNVPVVVTTQYGERMGSVIPEISELTDAAECMPIDKLVFSSAASQEFADKLLEIDRNQVLICGVETHICILQTALDLAHLDYQVHCAADAVSSRTMEKHKLGMEKMRDCGVLPCAAEGAVMELLFEAGTIEFKSILQLIK